MNRTINKIMKIDYEGIIPKLSASILLFLFINLIRIFLTILNFQSWYISLNKPFFALPENLFDPLWLIISLITAIAFYIVWYKGFEKKEVKIALYAIIAAAIINLVNAGIFFILKMPLAGFLVSIILIALSLIALKRFNEVSKKASLLLIPYILWIIYLSILELGIVFLN